MEKITTRGMRNKNPFNIKISQNSWKGKLKHSNDSIFEQFHSMRLGIRAGILLLANAYIRKGYDTPQKIIPRFAPSSENDVTRYLDFVCAAPNLDYKKAIVIHSVDFYTLCKRICLYESGYDLEYSLFMDIVHENHIF